MKVGTGMNAVVKKTIFPNEPTDRRVPSVSPEKRNPLPTPQLRYPPRHLKPVRTRVYATERTQQPPALTLFRTDHGERYFAVSGPRLPGGGGDMPLG